MHTGHLNWFSRAPSRFLNCNSFFFFSSFSFATRGSREIYMFLSTYTSAVRDTDSHLGYRKNGFPLIIMQLYGTLNRNVRFQINHNYYLYPMRGSFIISVLMLRKTRINSFHKNTIHMYNIDEIHYVVNRSGVKSCNVSICRTLADLNLTPL